jgi:hypothetical protein
MKKGGTMAEEGKEEALFKRVENLGLRVEYDSGFVAVTRSPLAERRDDDGEVVEAVLEQVGKHLPDVTCIAVGKARGARARGFLGSSVFVPSIEAFGTLADCGADGIVKTSYRRQSFRDPEAEVDLIHSGAGNDLLIIVDDERTAPASKTSFAWIEETTHSEERVRRLFERADAAGLTPAHDSGFTVVSRRPVAGVERAAVEATMRELGHHLREVSVRLAARARGSRSANLIGRRVLVPEFNAFGILAGSSADGRVMVTYVDPHMKSEFTCWCKGDALLIVPDEEAAAAASAAPNSETTWRRLMRRAFGG